MLTLAHTGKADADSKRKWDMESLLTELFWLSRVKKICVIYSNIPMV